MISVWWLVAVLFLGCIYIPFAFIASFMEQERDNENFVQEVARLGGFILFTVCLISSITLCIMYSPEYINIDIKFTHPTEVKE